ncbi:MAG: c-type cytochrome, partial [Planctomycetales bacterium]
MKDSGARSKSSLPWSRNFLLGLFVVLLACGKGCQCSSSAPPDRAPRFVTSKKSQGGTEAQVAQPGTEHGGTETQAGQPGTEEEGVATVGHKLYVQHCAACHGEKGDGKGLAAAYLFPKPRDFSSGFRLVSTNNATPSPADVEAVLTRGMPGSAMPPWAHLSAQDRAALAEEVLRLRGSLIR